MPTIVIGSSIIDIPDSGASPNWAPAIIEAFQAIEAALQGFVGPFDVAPQTFVIDAQNPGSNIDIPGLTFPPSDVRAAFIRYTVHRETTTTEVNEQGELWAIYNDTNGTFDFSQQKSDDADISFSITNVGQVQLTTTALGGLSHTGFITFTAQSLQNP